VLSDDDVRSSCFASLDVLCAKFGEDIPYREGLDVGFPFRANRVSFLSHMKGIYRAAAQRGPAALSINTSSRSPYGDRETDEGVLYAYRSGEFAEADNRALRAAFELQVPLVYFVGTRPGWYKPFYPCYVVADDPIAQEVLVTKGEMAGPFEEREPILSEDPIERRYAVREMRVRAPGAVPQPGDPCVYLAMCDLPAERDPSSRRRAHPERRRGSRRALSHERT